MTTLAYFGTKTRAAYRVYHVRPTPAGPIITTIAPRVSAGCIFCSKPFQPGERIETMGGDSIHRACGDEAVDFAHANDDEEEQ